MRPLDRFRHRPRLVLVAGDVAILCIALGVMLTLRDPQWFKPSLVLTFLPIGGCLVITAYAAGLYELRVVRDFVSLVGGLLASASVCALLGSAYFYALSAYLSFAPKITLLLAVLVTHAGMFAWRRAVLFITGFRLGDLNILMLADETYGEGVRTSIDRRVGTEFNLVEEMGRNVDLVVVDRRWSDRHAEQARTTLTAAIANLIPVVSVDEFHESMFGRITPERANDLGWALDHVLPRSGSMYFTAKRSFDLITVVVLLTVLAPLMALIAFFIRVLDGTSPFYGQERVGYLGRPFRLWKFQTMRPDAEREGPFIPHAGDGDPRATRLGSLLRRIRLDELPQLWNVLKGEMSLVGPRPEWIREVEILEKVIPTYSLRYLVPPGITGWAQVYYRATHNAADSAEKHNYDLYYLKHFSLALDFSIMLKTLKRVFVKDTRRTSIPAPASQETATGSHVGLDIKSIVGRS